MNNLARRRAFRYLKRICTKCYTAKDLTVHHKDENPNNNQLGNLEIVCRKCHNKLHKLRESRKRKHQKGNPKKARGTKRKTKR